MAFGFVYFASNPSMPGVYKIGITRNHPQVRLAALSGATGCPEPFQLLGYFDTEIPEEAEREIHKALDKYRVNDRREFFRAPLADLQNQARCWGDPSRVLGCWSMKWLDYLVAEECLPEDKAHELMEPD